MNLFGPVFTCKGDVIEHLYEIKEQFEERVYEIDKDYLCYCFDVIEKIIPSCKYFDIDVQDLCCDVVDIIFNKYSLIVLLKSDMHLADNLNHNIIYN